MKVSDGNKFQIADQIVNRIACIIACRIAQKSNLKKKTQINNQKLNICKVRDYFTYIYVQHKYIFQKVLHISNGVMAVVVLFLCVQLCCYALVYCSNMANNQNGHVSSAL